MPPLKNIFLRISHARSQAEFYHMSGDIFVGTASNRNKSEKKRDKSAENGFFFLDILALISGLLAPLIYLVFSKYLFTATRCLTTS